MSDRASDTPRDDDEFAAEYALGVLDATERRRAEQLAGRDPDFAALITAWEARLSPLVEEVRPVEPPPAVWSRIEALTAAPGPAAAERVAAGRASAGLAFWRWLSFGSMAVPAASTAAAVLLARPPAPVPLQLAALSTTDGRSAFTVLIDRASGQATLVPIAAWDAPGRVPELWLVPASGAAVSLGVFDPAKPARIAVPRPLLDGVSPGLTLAISVEPPGGSPTGKATGPVIALGKVQTL